jgi:broad specificity phosphatase PhoE
MTIVYIRHAEKEYKNGYNHLFPHDPSLTTDGLLNSIQKGIQLYNYIGAPNVIYCSPFQRTRETMNALLGEIPISSDLQCYCLPEISEYLGNWKQYEVKVRPETLFYNPLVCTMSEFETKIKNHLEEFKKINNSNNVIWVITHGLVMKKISEIYNYNVSEIPYLGTMILDETDTLLISF